MSIADFVRCRLRDLVLILPGILVLLGLNRGLAQPAPPGGRLDRGLVAVEPFEPGLRFPRLVTPQWVGEEGVEAVVILAIDDLRATARYEEFLRPILDRLKAVNGRRAPLSIFCNAVDPVDPRLVAWLAEGVSLEVHTLSHPCPILDKGNFAAAMETYHGGVDLLSRIPGNKPVAFRTPCCDSMNSPSPRLFAGILNQVSKEGRFLGIDSSVMTVFTTNDVSLPREWVIRPDGQPRFQRYVPSELFGTYLEDYPYPYLVGHKIWEFPPVVPSDWEAQKLHGANQDETVADWERALDIVVRKQGVFPFIFHPHGWIKPEQMIRFIEYAVATYGRKVRFMNFREAQERLEKHLLGGHTTRAGDGEDHGVRLVDLDQDGYQDVLIGAPGKRLTRLWRPEKQRWEEASLPVAFVGKGGVQETSVGLGSPEGRGRPVLFDLGATRRNAWRWEGGRWRQDESFLAGLEVNGVPVVGSVNGRDQGVRFVDLNSDGASEVIAGHPAVRSVFEWDRGGRRWKRTGYDLPEKLGVVDEQGNDAGLRFVDLNDDGNLDLVYSGPERFSVHLFISVARDGLGWQRGWSFTSVAGVHGDALDIPAIVRADGVTRNNGVWFARGMMWAQNEDTGSLPGHVARRTFEQLSNGMEEGPKGPAESLAAMEIVPGFRVELAAAEPGVVDPVAFDWGADGRFWVVEMRDYPLGMDGHGRAGGRVKFLEDADGDGVYEKATVFLDGIPFPNSIMAWGRGVLVTAAPEVFYAEDGDGDGRAEIVRPLMAGFVPGNQQHRVNGFEWGLDNWVYLANGDSGGSIRVVGTTSGPLKSPGEPRDLRGSDLRFRPETGELELVAGTTQFGRRRDDEGNWYGNNNPTWLWHYWMEPRYAVRNPHMDPPDVRHVLSNYPDNTRVFAVARPQLRMNWADAAFQVTSANSPTPYRDVLFGPDHRGSIFMSEPAHQTVHREVIERDGYGLRSLRPAAEKDREFLASRDPYFRPTMLRTGPDGALYIADMYRLVIEHPEYFPEEMKRRKDLRSGDDRGRIYRVLPVGAERRRIPNLAALAPEALVERLGSPNGWERDTAQRLLIRHRDRALAAKVQEFGASSTNALARMHAVGTLEGMGQMNPMLLHYVLSDRDPRVLVQAMVLAERYLRLLPVKEGGDGGSSDLRGLREMCGSLLRLTNSTVPAVRLQLAFTLGEWREEGAGKALAALALGGPWKGELRTAVLSSLEPHLATVAAAVVAPAAASSTHADLMADLLKLAVVSQNRAVEETVLQEAFDAAHDPAFRMRVVAGLLQGLERLKVSLETHAGTGSAVLGRTLSGLGDLRSAAKRIIGDPAMGVERKREVLSILGSVAETRMDDVEYLVGRFADASDPGLQPAIVDRLRELRVPATAKVLLAAWNRMTPEPRRLAVELLVARGDWTGALLDAIESEQVPATSILPSQQRVLTGQGAAHHRARASRLFRPLDPDRKGVLSRYSGVGQLTGVVDRGGGLFRQYCAMCHRLGGEGAFVGPDLASVVSKPVDQLILAILDPNQAVDAAYAAYVVETKQGETVTGVIVSESVAGVKLRVAGGGERNIPRGEVVSIAAQKLSLMPDGFEQFLNPQDMTDLLSYIRVKGQATSLPGPRN